MKEKSVLMAEARCEKNVHKKYIDKWAAQMFAYYSDNDKDSRKAKHECKYCYYVMFARVGGSAMTTKDCEYCGEKMLFSSTNTDKFCEKCSEELGLCKHCGQKME